jgi:hypothetical protein
VVTGGTLVVASDTALLDGSSLTVGADALSIFASPPVPAAPAGAPVPVAAPGVAPVPEPSTLALLVVGAALAVLYRRRYVR